MGHEVDRAVKRDDSTTAASEQRLLRSDTIGQFTCVHPAKRARVVAELREPPLPQLAPPLVDDEVLAIAGPVWELVRVRLPDLPAGIDVPQSRGADHPSAVAGNFNADRLILRAGLSDRSVQLRNVRK